MTTSASRIDSLDAARGLGIVLLYCVHLCDRLMELGFESTLPISMILTATVVPLFFFLAGAVAKKTSQAPLTILTTKLRRCLLPVVFFSVLMLPWWILHGTSADELQRSAIMYLYGLPFLHWPMWYMIALLWVELVGAAIFALFGESRIRAGLWCAFFAIAGNVITPEIIRFNRNCGIYGESWFLAESLVCLAFYFAGSATRTWIAALPDKTWLAGFSVTAAIAAMAASQFINQLFFKTVILSFSVHGNYAWFMTTAFLGIISAMLLAKSVPADTTLARALRFLGRHSLFYYGLNGICCIYLDRKVLQVLAPPDTLLVLLPFIIVYCASLLVLFTPLAMLLKRYCSSLLGLPSAARA